MEQELSDNRMEETEERYRWMVNNHQHENHV